MSTSVEIELVSPEEERLLHNSEEQQSSSESSSSKSTSVQIALVSEEERLLDTFEQQLKPRQTIFLSHSGAQKNFVEQLCEDLERAKQSPFFDKRPDSLPKGEVFARYIFRAAQQCELAIVVVSEEYFSRTKWPMLELCAFVQSRKCKILPLFFGLSCKDFATPETRQRWFQTWDAWAQADPRIRVDDWKHALRELDRRNGLEYVEAMGEVGYRKDVVATACIIMHEISQNKVLPDPSIHKRSLAAWRFIRTGAFILLKILGGIIAYIVVFVIFGLIFFKIIVPFLEKFLLPPNF